MQRTVAIFGGSFNPPGIHHRLIVEFLLKIYDLVLVIPCGMRPDKTKTNVIDPRNRKIMCEMVFGQMPRVILLTFDLTGGVYTPNHDLQKRLAHYGELHHIVGADIVKNGAKGESDIQTVWYFGKWCWNNLRFGLLRRSGYNLLPEDCPPRARVFDLDIPGSSSDVRDRRAEDLPISGLVTREVEGYIFENGLYRLNT